MKGCRQSGNRLALLRYQLAIRLVEGETQNRKRIIRISLVALASNRLVDILHVQPN